MRHASSVFVVLATCLVVVPTPSEANQPEFIGSSASHVQTLDCDTKAKNFDRFALGWLVDGSPVEGGERSIRCTTTITNEKGNGRKGVKVTLTGEILDPNTGQPLDSLGTRSGRTNGAGQRTFEFDLPTGLADDYLVGFEGRYGGAKKGVSAATTCTARNRLNCQADDDTACLLSDDRFKVEIEWRSFTGAGQGEVISSASGEALFFFDTGLGDLLVQLLDRCRINDHFWVFSSATTDVEYDLTVTDTETGATRSYTNPLGQPAPAITDTSAFATCP